MFNDLTDNNQKTSEVDDIFAETDKAPTPSSGAQIQTRQVGLSSLSEKPMNDEGVSRDDDRHEQAKTGKFLKIAIIFVILAIIILGAYLLYSKFLAVEKVNELEPVAKVDDNKEGANTGVVADDNQVATEDKNDNFVTPMVDQENPGGLNVDNINSDLNTDTDKMKLTDSDGDGISDYDEIFTYKTDSKLIDTDIDGLNDYDEIFKYKTDPLKSDTDGDGLSDYQEVMTYKSDPLKSDTDGDGYSDYEEVMTGHNPLGKGVLPGF